MNHLQHWNVSTSEDNIAYWTLDRKESSVNTLSKAVFEELEQLVILTEKAIDDKSAPLGIIIQSGKSYGFIAGADIQGFTHIDSYEEAVKYVIQIQQLFFRLESLKIPTVAIIKDFCMGGGTELALACRYRVLKDDSLTRIGLPEVKLGLQPGWGGTIRLPKLIGTLEALQLILKGTSINPQKAFKLGLADAIVPERHLEACAKKFILEKPKKHQSSWIKQLPNVKLLRPLIARFLRKMVSKHARLEHYPAPYAIIDLWEKDGYTDPASFQHEAESIVRLIMGETAQNLIRVFFLQRQLKTMGKQAQFKPKRVHVIGAGVMGGDIAAWCALNGLIVTLQDREAKFISPAIKRAHQLFQSKLKIPFLIQQAIDRLIPDIEGEGIAKADVIIEAVVENADIKKTLFKHLEETAKPDALLATNTSGIPLSTIGAEMKDPARVIGIHFFNPVAKMPLVEIVHEESTSVELIEKVSCFVHIIDKLPIPVKSAPGFLINRILMPYMMEALMMYKEGIKPEIIDQIAVEFGMPMGPIELADTVGLDVCLSVAKYLLNNEVYQPLVKDLQKMIEEKKCGKKTGMGFYVYKNNHAVKKPIEKNAITAEEKQWMTDRLMLKMVNESIACLRENIVDNTDLLDAGMIFGTGFAPFRGGPITYAEKLGHEVVVEKLKSLSQKYGERFSPDKGWFE